MEAYLLLCRPGFEGDCAAELAVRDGTGYARVRPDSGWLVWHSGRTPASGLVFPRSGFRLQAEALELPERDRLAVLLPHIRDSGPWREVRLECPDTNAGRGLQRFFRRFRGALTGALASEGLLRPLDRALPILHLFFTSSSQVFAGVSRGREAGPWENGIPRLRLSPSAPSRSALKLEEAWLTLMSGEERDHWLRPGLSAVDLGAAPGGWTWQLARRGLSVTAVDHGRLAPVLQQEYPVQHVAADAFTWQPPRPVDRVVCDIVDKPARTLALMEKWLTRGWAGLAVFNLKLPMKRRHAAVDELLGRLRGSLPPGLEVRARQLYHDREEITVAVVPRSARAR